MTAVIQKTNFKHSDIFKIYSVWSGAIWVTGGKPMNLKRFCNVQSLYNNVHKQSNIKR